MKLYFVFITVTYLFWFAGAHAFVNFKGTSKKFGFFLSTVGGLGHLLMLAVVIYSCFKCAHWYYPAIAYIIGIPLARFVPKDQNVEAKMSFYFYPLLIVLFILIMFDV